MLLLVEKRIKEQPEQLVAMQIENQKEWEFYLNIKEKRHHFQKAYNQTKNNNRDFASIGYLIFISINSLKMQWKYHMMKREYTITNPRARRTKDENQRSGETLAGLPQVQFTKKIR